MSHTEFRLWMESLIRFVRRHGLSDRTENLEGVDLPFYFGWTYKKFIYKQMIIKLIS